MSEVVVLSPDALRSLVHEAVREALASAVPSQPEAGPQWLDAESAGHYLGTTRKRIHDLTSARALVPDGYDGRKPLYLRSSLDAYVKGAAS